MRVQGARRLTFTVIAANFAVLAYVIGQIKPKAQL